MILSNLIKICVKYNFGSQKYIFINILRSILKQLEECKIWEYTIQWVKLKHSTLPTNPKEWTSDNFSPLKETLINVFRTLNISAFLHALEISSWINRYIENNSYEFKLLVKGFRDGFDIKTIYNLVIVEGTEEILGGYNPLDWDIDNDQFKKTEDKGNLKTKKNCFCISSTYSKPIRPISPSNLFADVSHEFLFSVEELKLKIRSNRENLNGKLLIEMMKIRFNNDLITTVKKKNEFPLQKQFSDIFCYRAGEPATVSSWRTVRNLSLLFRSNRENLNGKLLIEVYLSIIKTFRVKTCFIKFSYKKMMKIRFNNDLITTVKKKNEFPLQKQFSDIFCYRAGEPATVSSWRTMAREFVDDLFVRYQSKLPPSNYSDAPKVCINEIDTLEFEGETFIKKELKSKKRTDIEKAAQEWANYILMKFLRTILVH
ncbi:hypothetical protein Glove_185g61 [Diversispora epigaea]|uniref:Uncharacterized protein n=1 Tax=Diversispora epigaea TaxID=1348612 RepID=A0A397IMJ3_9GLOM|nr:hypothetical protein Glove_185g61 [Diversispora epigaea]